MPQRDRHISFDTNHLAEGIDPFHPDVIAPPRVTTAEWSDQFD
jgi:hypothetical protein